MTEPSNWLPGHEQVSANLSMLSPGQQDVSDATVGTIQRMAMRIVDVPRERREAAYERIRKNYLDAAGEIEPLSDFTCSWIEMTVVAIKRLVADFDAIGSGHA